MSWLPQKKHHTRSLTYCGTDNKWPRSAAPYRRTRLERVWLGVCQCEEEEEGGLRVCDQTSPPLRAPSEASTPLIVSRALNCFCLTILSYLPNKWTAKIQQQSSRLCARRRRLVATCERARSLARSRWSAKVQLVGQVISRETNFTASVASRHYLRITKPPPPPPPGKGKVSERGGDNA